MERRMISPGFVEDALACLQEVGKDARPLLLECGLSPDNSEPISNTQYGLLWWRIAEEIQDEFFNLAARPMRPGSFSLLCHCLLTCEDLEEALDRALLFLGVVLDDPRGKLVREGNSAVIVLHAQQARSAFAYRTYWLILMGVASWLVGRRLSLRQLEFACPAPASREDYHRFFGAPVAFDCRETRLILDAAHLGLPVVRNETALRIFLRDAPGNILVRYRHDQELSGRIRQILDEHPPTEWPRFEHLAAMLKLSPATLRRRLKAEGQSYGTIKDDLRILTARKLLEDGSLTVAEIANHLGYSEPSAFYRAYRKLTGETPRTNPQ